MKLLPILIPALAGCLLGASVPAFAEDTIVKTVGYAWDLDTNEYAYTEVSEDRMVAGRWVGGTTHYFAADGTEFAVKTAAPGQDELLPLYRLEIPKLPYAEGITGNGDQILMTRQTGDKAEHGAAPREGIVVADFGLSDLLSRHLDELQRGATLKFRVAAPSVLDTFRFRAQRVADTLFENQAATQVQVDMDSLLHLFTGPLTFVYNAASRKLVEFRGNSGLINPRTGKAWTVRISYPSARPKDAPPLPP